MSVFKKWILPALLAGVLLAGCGGDGTSGEDYAARLRGDKQPMTGAQTELQAPTPQTQRVEVTRIVKDVQRVEVPVVQYVEVTPQPDVQGFAAPASAGECNTYIALPVTVDDDGTIRGEYFMCAWETAVAYSNGVQP